MSGTAKQMEMIAALLRQETTLALATADAHGDPCIAPLFYLAGADLSLYWLSSPSSLHSRNLEREPNAAATVYRHAEKWKDICGVQIRGSVTVITDPSRRKALIKLYCERFQLSSIFRLAIGRSRLYEFSPAFFRYLDNSKRFGYTFEVTLDADNPEQSGLPVL
ncbi:MAG: pyridoxamine 5'-phosphate oxidase family protein [Terracidiphilus sp.]|nr:pyridoxamine 5'-phosphate oxidase family protein [Terracidiphilus sp.]